MWLYYCKLFLLWSWSLSGHKKCLFSALDTNEKSYYHHYHHYNFHHYHHNYQCYHDHPHYDQFQHYRHQYHHHSLHIHIHNLINLLIIIKFLARNTGGLLVVLWNGDCEVLVSSHKLDECFFHNVVIY